MSATEIENLSTLALAAEEAGNLQEANALWSRILEKDPKNADAWLGKARSVPISLGTFPGCYEEAESYCNRAIACASDVDKAKSEAFGALAARLMTMGQAAQAFFEEHPEVDTAAGEFAHEVLSVLDGYDRLATTTSGVLAHPAAIELCDRLLENPIVDQADEFKEEILKRRRLHMEKGGPLTAAMDDDEPKAEAKPKRQLKRRPLFDDDDDDEEDDNPGASGRRASDDGVPTWRRAVQFVMGAAALIVVILSFVGYGRWAGDPNKGSPSSITSPVATTTPSPEPSPSTTAAQPTASAAPASASAPLPSATSAIAHPAAKKAPPAKKKCQECNFNGRCNILSAGGDLPCCMPITNSVNGPEGAAECRKLLGQ